DVENVSPVEKKVTVEVDPVRVVHELDRAYVGLGRRVKLRGFRPGKAPRQVLERNFKDDVERQVTETLVREAFEEAVRSNDIAAVAPPRVDVASAGLDPSQPFKFTARVEVKPRLEPKDYKGLEVTHRPASVTDAMVQEELSRLQESMAQLVPVEGRLEAQDGDYAVVDHSTLVDGQPYPNGSGEGITMRVSAGDLFQGFVPQLAGKKLDEAMTVEQAFPADFHDEAMRGKVARFEVTLKALKQRNLPALDDAFAKDLGIEGVETADQLRERVKTELEKREKRRADSELKDALVKAALAKNEFEVPPALVERAIDVMLQGALERFARQGIDVRKMGLDLPRLRADLREQALLQVKGALLLEAIADQEKVELADAEFQQEIARTADELGVPLAKLQRQMGSPDARAAMRTRLREDRALALMTSEARIQGAGA
ncbi:MAG: trigger factor, partial [Anaeromyxobacteraceae bacterium]